MNNQYSQLLQIYRDKSKKWHSPIITNKPKSNKNFYSEKDIREFVEDSDFTSVNIKEDIMNYKYVYFVNYGNIYLYLILQDPLKSKGKRFKITKEIKEILLTIATIQNFLEKYSKNSNKAKDLHIILIPTCYKKKLPNKPNHEIGIHECNSGVNISYGNGDKVIIIWRKEEQLKVIIHELIHYYKFDKGIKNVNLQEAYTETMANYLYQHMKHILTNNIHNNNIHNNNDYNKLDKNLKKEQDFSQYQTAKIIDYIYPEKWPNITPQQPIPEDLYEKMSNNTSVFGYYWCKSALLSNIDRMKDFWDKNNYQVNEKNLQLFQDIVKESLSNETFQKNIKNWQKHLNNPPDKKWKKTLRMTII